MSEFVALTFGVTKNCRYNYDPDEVLGPKRFRIDGRLFERVDLEVILF